MPPAALPGFHYDASKKKYFKIQPNHVAAHGPSASKYTKAAVKQEAEKQREWKRRKLFKQREGKMVRMQRSKVLESPLGGACGLMRELGLTTTRFESGNVVGVRAWAQGLRRKGEVLKYRGGRDGGGAGSLGPFVVDAAAGVLTFAETRGGDVDARVFTRHVVPPPTCDEGRGGWGELGAMLGSHFFSSQVTSMDISPSRVLMTTTMGGSQPACVHLTKLIEPEEWTARYESYMTTTTTHARDDDLPSSYTSDVSTIIRPQTTNATFWASSSRPDTTLSDFAIATSYGTVIVAEAQSSWSFDRVQTFKHDNDGSDDASSSSSSEVLAVDWLDTNVLLNGCRDGTVRLWDARVCGAGVGTSWRVRHPSCVNHVRKLDANRIVVAGLQRRMAVYDLRFIRTKDDDVSRGGVVTRPYVEFPAYRNEELNGVAVGFDVCGDLVAAGTDDEGGVQIFDGASGREVMVGVGGEMGKEMGGPARCVRFVEGEEGREGRKLFVAGARGIEQWAW